MNTTAAAPIGAAEAPNSDAQKIQLKRLTQEFEAMFLAEMLRGMRSSMLEDQQDEGLGNDTMIDTFDVELGRSLSMGGGLGLSAIMLDALSRREGSTTGTATSGNTLPGSANAGTAPGSVRATSAASQAYASARAAVERAALVTAQSSPFAVPARVGEADTRPAAAAHDGSAGEGAEGAMPGQVTSKFGWRKDPFTGKAQFHAGTDVRMAYGGEVQSVAAGQVISVGERSGYGLTVVIDHGNGLETRYAHLSGTEVRVGERVEAGQVVARSGNSGRSTGPHLHMEARMNGRAVDVSSVLKSKA